MRPYPASYWAILTTYLFNLWDQFDLDWLQRLMCDVKWHQARMTKRYREMYDLVSMHETMIILTAPTSSLISQQILRVLVKIGWAHSSPLLFSTFKSHVLEFKASRYRLQSQSAVICLVEVLLALTRFSFCVCWMMCNGHRMAECVESMFHSWMFRFLMFLIIALNEKQVWQLILVGTGSLHCFSGSNEWTACSFIKKAYYLFFFHMHFVQCH